MPIYVEHTLTQDPLQLKRAHSAEPDTASVASTSTSAAKGAGGLEPSPLSRDANAQSTQSGSASPALASSKLEENPILGSPLKRHRPSVSGPTDRSAAAAAPSLALDSVLSSTPPTKTTFTAGGSNTNQMEEEEEL